MPKFDDYCEVIFWDFKRMDNVTYNFEILVSLIQGACKSSKKSHYYKPIIIQMMAIIECTLYDFLCHIKEERNEGINLSEQEKDIIRSKDVPKQFHKYVEICKHHKILGNKSPDIYEGLYKYMKIRNRVHIQNLHQYSPPKEYNMWTYHKVKSCGRLLRDVFLRLCENHPRPERFHTSPDLDKFPTPWAELE